MKIFPLLSTRAYFQCWKKLHLDKTLKNGEKLLLFFPTWLNNNSRVLRKSPLAFPVKFNIGNNLFRWNNTNWSWMNEFPLAPFSFHFNFSSSSSYQNKLHHNEKEWEFQVFEVRLNFKWKSHKIAGLFFGIKESILYFYLFQQCYAKALVALVTPAESYDHVHLLNEGIKESTRRYFELISSRHLRWECTSKLPDKKNSF